MITPNSQIPEDVFFVFVQIFINEPEHVQPRTLKCIAKNRIEICEKGKTAGVGGELFLASLFMRSYSIYLIFIKYTILLTYY